MRIAVITANLGNFDPVIKHVDQSLPCDFYRFTDENFPPRSKAMTPRLQARIVKMFGWQMVPGYDYYIWVDSSLILSDKDSVSWFLKQCESVDMAVFKHPERNTIQEEADFLKERINRKDSYILSRYENELVDEQLAAIKADKSFADQNLFASSALIYKNNSKVHNVMFQWWHHTSRYHTIDQLSLPYVLFKQNCSVRIIPDNYLKTTYLQHVRKFKDQEDWDNQNKEQYKKTEAELQVEKIMENLAKVESPQLQLDKPKEEPEGVSSNTTNQYQHVLDFWREWLEGNGKAFERSGRLINRFDFMLKGRKRATIANLGAGPVCLIGNWRRDIKVNIVSSDILADEYAKIRKELDLNPQYIVEKEDMENLSYGDNSFDIVYCANALDRTKNPRKALMEMFRLCKPDGYVYLRHIVDNDYRHLDKSPYKWKIELIESVDCRFSNYTSEQNGEGFLLSEVYQGFKSKVELTAKGVLITSYVQKK
ncbi:methyltransferase domain-containing protein [candidate division WWE3 bacterium]|jgi:ubiquinone/menaquinone biosynthesis C-methylase UbiE|uniref:Methyltransferase domain-containing protein n=1 Tax=candidate division WWE3 bacterium TaxID=2053526 RepID=A0A3A4ZCJ0_UNCKA|nr:MAG: methyltransferase domain-containing protein [candidate division WWE3 bacterium]